MQPILEKDLYDQFVQYTITELEELIIKSEAREKKIFYSRLLSIKIALAQEKVIGKHVRFINF